MAELKELLNEGGTKVFTTYAVKVGDSLWTALYSFVQEKEYASIEAVLTEGERNFAVIKDKNENVYSLDFSVAEDGAITLAEEVVSMDNYTPAEEPQFALSEIEAFEATFKKKCAKDEGKEDKTDKPDSEDKSEGKKDDNPAPGEKKPEDDDDSDDDDDEDKNDEDDKKKKKYSLEEIPEYVALQASFSELESKYNALVAEKETLESQIKPLQQFKLDTERVQKEEMIHKTFYMLSDEDKKDVIDNIDTYSLSDIEAKLSIICFRNKISYSALEDEDQNPDPTTYNLGGNLFQDDSTPAWVKAVLENAKTSN